LQLPTKKSGSACFSATRQSRSTRTHDTSRRARTQNGSHSSMWSSTSMPSDSRTQLGLSAVAGSRARFRSALENARDQMRTYIATHRGDSEDLATNTTRELGAFASGRIDTNRFANIFAAKGNVGLEVIARAERCMVVLNDLLLRGGDLFTTDAPRGAKPGNAV